MHSFGEMSIPEMLAEGARNAVRSKSDIHTAGLTIKLGNAQVRVWRMARLTQYFLTQAARINWADASCTCHDGETSGCDDASVHESCHKRNESAEMADGCECPFHVLESLAGALETDNGTIQTLKTGKLKDKRIRGLCPKADETDLAMAEWYSLPQAERMAQLGSESPQARPSLQYGYADGDDPMMRLARALSKAGDKRAERALEMMQADEARAHQAPMALAETDTHSPYPVRHDSADIPGEPQAPHTCHDRLPGEMWAAYGQRVKSCPMCREEREHIPLPSAPVVSPSWEGLQASRLASRGRYARTAGPGIGARRIPNAG